MNRFPIEEYCSKYNLNYGIYDVLDSHWNFKKAVPCNNLGTFSDGIDAYNDIKKALIDWAEQPHINKIKWTQRGYVCKDTRGKENYVWYHIYSYDIRESKALAEMIIFSHGLCLRVCMGREKEDTLSGSKAFYLLSRELKKDGHNIEDYAVDNYDEAVKIKESIPSPKIELTITGKMMMGLDIPDCHYADEHSAYPSGIIKQFPELTDTLTRLYNNRKDKPINKQIMNLAIGYAQSEACHYRYVKLAKAAVTYAREYIENLANKIEQSGRAVLNFMTDACMYHGEIYHDENEYDGLGGWGHEYTNVTASFKTTRAYEFTEKDNTYHVRYSGMTELDYIKPRDQWVKGDIYKTKTLNLKKTKDKYEIYYWEKTND